MSDATTDFRFRSIVLPAITPALLFAIGEGAIIPIIPVVAHNLGAPLAIAGLIAAMLLVGQVFGDIPSGWTVAKLGERNAMILAALVSVVGLLAALFAPNPLVLGVGIFAIGLSTAVFALGRQAFMATFVPLHFRARALSTLGGTFRLGYFVGPLISALIIHLTGSVQIVFLVHIVGCIGAAVVLFVLRDPSDIIAAKRMAVIEAEEPSPIGLWRVIWNRRDVLIRLGTGAALIGAMRSSRQVILPLWAVSIHVPEAETALIIGIAGAIDFALFYTSGQIMDRYGRLWSALPAMLGLSAGFIALAFTHDVPAAAFWFIGAAFFMSVANGVGSGILMTLGADLAEPRNPAPFLGAWRFTGDLGGAGAPLALSALTGLFSIAFASGFLGVVGIVGAVILLRYVPRYSVGVRRR